MRRLPRILPCVALACSMSVTVISGPWALGAPKDKNPAAGQKKAAGGDASAPADAAAPADAGAGAAPADAGGAGDAGDAKMPKKAAGGDAGAADATNGAAAGGTDTTTGAGAGAGAADTTAAGATTEPADATAPEVPANQPLAARVDDFWHYGEVARYDLQAAIGKRLVQEGQQNPEELLRTFEQVAAQHRQLNGEPTNLDAELIRWQTADPAIRPVASQIIDLLNKGRFARRQNQQFIAENIKRLNDGERGYSLAIQQLRNSGELAVPQMVNILVSQRPEDVEFHDVIRHALVDLGREALNPLLAATQMNPREVALTTICGVLADIGYPVSAPYLVALAQNNQASAEVRDAATNALRRLNVDPRSNSGDQFYGLSEKFYYGNASIQADPRSPTAFIWYWTVSGLVNKPVPPTIFNDIMTMREAEHALHLRPSKPDEVVAMWLAGNIRRSIDLPQGGTDPTRSETEPSPHYYSVAEGAQYLNLVLDRSLKDNTPQSSAVALAAIRSLQDIVGQSNLFTGGRGQPLVEAMRYPDRQVRFEAAFALASALPQRPFQGQERVVPLLAEAVTQSGTPGVLVVAPQNDRTRLQADLKAYSTAGGSTPATAIANAASMPGVDVILMPEDLGNTEIDRTLDLAGQNPRFERAAKLIIVHSLASPWARAAVTDPTITATQAAGGPALVAAVEQARKRAGGLPVDAKVASDFSLRSANLLAKLAISRGQVFNLSVAEPTLIASLGDKRPQIAKAVGETVALYNTRQSQGALADRANEAATPAEVRVSLYKSLATSAKFWGNLLEPQQITQLRQEVISEKNLDVRSAAAEARGALNLPPSDNKSLILERHD